MEIRLVNLQRTPPAYWVGRVEPGDRILVDHGVVGAGRSACLPGEGRAEGRLRELAARYEAEGYRPATDDDTPMMLELAQRHARPAVAFRARTPQARPGRATLTVEYRTAGLAPVAALAKRNRMIERVLAALQDAGLGRFAQAGLSYGVAEARFHVEDAARAERLVRRALDGTRLGDYHALTVDGA